MSIFLRCCGYDPNPQDTSTSEGTQEGQLNPPLPLDDVQLHTTSTAPPNLQDRITPYAKPDQPIFERIFEYVYHPATYADKPKGTQHAPNCQADLNALKGMLTRTKSLYGEKLFETMVDIHLQRHPLPKDITRNTMSARMKLAAFRTEFFPLVNLHFETHERPDDCTVNDLINAVITEFQDIDDYGMDAINGLVPNPDGKLSLADQLRAFRVVVTRNACHFFDKTFRNDQGIQGIFQETFANEDDIQESQLLEAYSRIQEYLNENELSIEEINIDSGMIQIIPKEIVKISGLKKICFWVHRYQDDDYKGIRYLPANFGELKSLTQLTLQRLPLAELPSSFGNLPALQTLTLESLPLAELPSSFGNLPALQTLTLESLPLAELPSSFGNLPALQTLILQRLPLAELPSSFGNLPALQTLTLQRLPLAELPSSFGNLPALSELDLTGTQLLRLPESFSKLAALTQLRLFNTPILLLPNNFCNLTALTTLTLCNTPIMWLPESFGSLTALTQLDLEKTQLQRLPESFGNLSALTELNLNGTLLKLLPESFGSLTALTQLDLGETLLQRLPESFGSLTALTQLDLRKTLLQRLLEELRQSIRSYGAKPVWHTIKAATGELR